MSINTVEGHIGLSVNEPLREWRIPFQHSLPAFEPMKFGSDIGPITLGIFCGPLGNRIVDFKAVNMSMLRKLRGRSKDALLFK